MAEHFNDSIFGFYLKTKTYVYYLKTVFLRPGFKTNECPLLLSSCYEYAINSLANNFTFNWTNIDQSQDGFLFPPFPGAQ